jgi:hypothetical protein
MICWSWNLGFGPVISSLCLDQGDLVSSHVSLGDPAAWVLGRWFGMKWWFLEVATEVLLAMEVAQR